MSMRDCPSCGNKVDVNKMMGELRKEPGKKFHCEKCNEEIRPGALLAGVTSDIKKATARANGAKGGRPRNPDSKRNKK